MNANAQTLGSTFTKMTFQRAKLVDKKKFFFVFYQNVFPSALIETRASLWKTSEKKTSDSMISETRRATGYSSPCCAECRRAARPPDQSHMSTWQPRD